MDMDIFEIGAWAGTEASLSGYIAALKRIDAEGLTEKRANHADGMLEARPPRLFSQVGSVGVISISGPLNNSSSWMNAAFGFSGYPEIREALVHAAMSADVKSIVLDVKSGGGMVSGCSDTGDLIKTINAKVKPIATYSDGMIASAAYWLGSSAGSVTIGNVTEAGSIGVLVMQQEFSRALDKDGITVNVVRSGKFKALGNSAEPLSALGRETLQAQVDYLSNLFDEHVAEVRGTTAAIVNQKMGQGRVFIGQEALDVGLVDAVSNFDTFMSKIQGEIDSGKQQPKYGANLPKGSISMKNALTEQAIAALALGAVSAAAAEAVAAGGAPADDIIRVELLAHADEVIAPGAEVKPANAEVVALLQSQLAGAQGQVLQLSIDLHASRASAESAKASADVMRPTIRASVGNMRIALKRVAAGVELLTDENLMSEHANLAVQFNKMYPAGGVAAVTWPADAEKVGAQVEDPIRKARLDATRNRKQK